MGLAHQLHLYGHPLVVATFTEKYPCLFIHTSRYGRMSTRSHAGSGNSSSSLLTARGGVLIIPLPVSKASPLTWLRSLCCCSSELITSTTVISPSPMITQSAPPRKYRS